MCNAQGAMASLGAPTCRISHGSHACMHARTPLRLQAAPQVTVSYAPARQRSDMATGDQMTAVSMSMYNWEVSGRITCMRRHRTESRPSRNTSNAGFPVRSSYTITPSDHASTGACERMLFWPVRHACMVSGAAYPKVKLRGACSSSLAAQPKSMRVHWFSRGSHITLAGLRSRCA